MAEITGSPVIHALAWALAHSVWQGALIALMAYGLMRAASSPDTRYAVGVGALVAMVGAPVATFVALSSGVFDVIPRPGAASGALAAVADAPPASSLTSGATGSAAGTPEPSTTAWWLSAIVLAWAAGVVVFSLRLAGGWLVARRLARQAVRPAAAHLQQLAADVAARLDLRRGVRLLESSAVAVPVLVGWLRPTVVFPVAALAGLSPAQVEALLAHELAHVRRHDYLINLLQSFAEVVVFYHPAVWWVSRRIRAERERCCDDIAVGVCDRLTYATALSDLAAMTTPRLAMAATGGDLLARVRRILEREESPMSMTSRWTAAALVVGLAVPVALLSARQAPKTPAMPDVRVAAPLNPPAVSIASKDTTITAGAIELRGDVGVKMEAGRPLEVTLGGVTFVEQSTAAEREARLRYLRELEVQRERELQAEREAREARAVRQQAELDLVAREYERLRVMYDKGMVSAQQLREAEFALASAKAGDDVERRRQLELEFAARRLEDARLRQQIGTTSSDEVAKMEAELALLRAQASGDQREFIEVQRAEAKREYDRALAMVEKGLLAPGQLVEFERRLAALEQKLTGELPDRLQHQKDVIDKMRAIELERQKRVEDVRIKVEDARPAVSTADADLKRPLVAGDTLWITIDGEPDLPKAYRVQPDGSIRLPLLGAFKVIGQTPIQVRDTIGKRLADSRLGTAASVKVAIQIVVRRTGSHFR